LVARRNVGRQIEEGRISEKQAGYLIADYKDIPAQVIVQHNLIEFSPPQLPMDLVSDDYRRQVETDPVQRSFRAEGRMVWRMQGSLLDGTRT
jgi:hypothetical protein